MSYLFRKCHRWLAIIGALPLLGTVITGIAFPFAKMLHQRQLSNYVAPTASLATRSTRVLVNPSA